MASLLLCLSLLAFCFSFKRFFSVSIEKTPFLSLSCIITALYFFAYCSFLTLGLYCVFSLGAVLSLYFFYFFVGCDARVLSQYLTPGFVFWLTLTALTAFLLSFSSFSVWDEFMHWAPLAKVMSLRGDLLYGDYQLVHKSYPPGARLFYMLFFVPAGFDEGRAYIAQTLIIFAPLATLFRWTDWRKWRRISVMSCTVFIVVCFLLDSWVPVSSLYMDVPVAFFVGDIVIVYYHSERRAIDIAWICPLVFSLMLLKLQLFPFILLILAMISVDLSIRKSWSTNKLLALTAVLLAALLAKWSWSMHLAHNGVAAEWGAMGLYSIVTIVPQIFSSAKPVAYNELINVINSEIPLLFLLLYISFLLPFVMRRGVSRVGWWSANALWFAGLLCYLLALFALRLTAFSGLYGHAYLRYSAIYYLAWSLFVCDGVYLVLYDSILPVSTRMKQIVFTFLCVSAILFLSFAYYKQQAMLRAGRSNAFLRTQINKIAERVKVLTPPGSRVFTVWQHSKGIGRTMLLYTLFPRGYNYVPTAFGDISAGEQGWKADLSLDAFKLRLVEFDYLLVAHDDKEFWRRYGDAMPNRAPMLTYQFCETEAFDSAGAQACQLRYYNAYLFKIEHAGSALHFINITPSDDTL